MKRILTIIIVFICVEAHAGYFLSHNNGNIIRTVKSCGAVCSNNPNLIRITEQEYNDSRLSNKKFDVSVITGSRIIDMTQAEIDAIAQAIFDARALAKSQRFQTLDDKVTNTDMSIPLTKVDNAINNIGSLNDAKDFLRKLVRYIVANQ